MQRSKLRLVLVLGASAMAGIIGMQAYWVSTTWNLNEEEFSKYLNELMHSENLREKFSERAKEVTNQFMATNVIDSWKKNIDNV